MSLDLPSIFCDVVYLKITEKPQATTCLHDDYTVSLQDFPDVDVYIDLYREIGRDYIWNYRPSQTRDEIERLIQSTNTKIYYLMFNDTPIGMAECDVTDSSEIEIVHFGLLPIFINKGIGRQFLGCVLEILWREGPQKIILSTCSLDHPKAVKFYQDAGFEIYKRSSAEFKDYRYSDFYEMTDAPQIPHQKNESLSDA